MSPFFVVPAMLCFYAELIPQAGIEGFMTKAPLTAIGTKPWVCLVRLKDFLETSHIT